MSLERLGATAKRLNAGQDRRTPAAPAKTAGANASEDAVGDTGARDCAAAWARIRARLKADYGDDVFRSWFHGLSYVEIDGMTVVLSVPTAFLRMWIRSNYGTRLLALWRSEVPSVERVDIRVRSVGAQAASPGQDRPAAGAPRPRGEAPPQPAGLEAGPGLDSAPLDPRFRFDSFAVGESNKIAHDTAWAVAAASGDNPAMFNPLFVHGGVGRGKTHLLHAIAWKVAEADPARRVLHLPAEQFVYRFVSALRSDSAIGFKEKLRQIDLLLIDDLQFLQGKATHREFGHTVNALIESCRQVVLVADRPPSELDGFDERTRSRLAGGLVVSIGQQELGLRRQILQSRAATLGARGQPVDLPPDVIDFVARNVASSGRELEGALNRLAAYRCFAGVPVTVELAERVIRDIVAGQERPQVRIEDIQRIVAGHFQISKADLISSRRTRAIVMPRQIAMYLSKTLTPRSLPEIGRRFGDRDHTTVLHAVRKIETLIAGDSSLARDVEGLRRRIEDGDA